MLQFMHFVEIFLARKADARNSRDFLDSEDGFASSGLPHTICYQFLMSCGQHADAWQVQVSDAYNFCFGQSG